MVGTVPDPLSGTSEVCVALEASETNFRDALVVEGSYQLKPPLPCKAVHQRAASTREIRMGARGIA